MGRSRTGIVAGIITVAIIIFMLWGIGSCTRVFFDPFSEQSANRSMQTATAGTQASSDASSASSSASEQ